MSCSPLPLCTWALGPIANGWAAISAHACLSHGPNSADLTVVACKHPQPSIAMDGRQWLPMRQNRGADAPQNPSPHFLSYLPTPSQRSKGRRCCDSWRRPEQMVVVRVRRIADRRRGAAPPARSRGHNLLPTSSFPLFHVPPFPYRRSRTAG